MQNYDRSNRQASSTKVKTNAFLILPNLGMLCVEGPNAKQFLQGQLTCNLEDISSTQSRLGAHCNPQGRIIHFFRLFLIEDRYYLQMPINMIPIAMNALKKYAVFFKVALTDASGLFDAIGYVGSNLEKYISALPKNIDEITHFSTLRILKFSERFQIIGSPADIKHLKEKFLIDNQEMPPETWAQLNFEENIPTIYPETSEKFLPHDIQLPQLNAVSFQKGCYTGQEIIARMQYRGKIKNQLFHLTLNTNLTPQRGADVYNSTHVAGMIVDFYKISDNTYHLQLMTSQKDDLDKDFRIAME